MEHLISSKLLTLEQLYNIVEQPVKLTLSIDAKERIDKCRSYLDDRFSGEDAAATYGINTGFGSLCNTHIGPGELQQLQHNLLMSHACGTGDEVAQEIVRMMLFLKIQSLSYGHSGISRAVVERLIAFFNNEIYPVIYEQGSLGASGDLAPLAHLALPLIGKGEVYFKGEKINAAVLNEKMGWEPLKLQSKEGLALINGTQFMLAFAVYTLIQSHKLWYWAHVTGAMSVDAFDCNLSPFDKRIHLIRPHAGQLRSSDLILSLLEDSQIAVGEKVNVQDPYSFRCIPQVHGATWDTLQFVKRTVLTEVNSVTDNPNIFPESEAIISGGNFHGQPLALALDYLGIAMAEIASISERRTFQLMSGTRGLPAFLVNNPGLNSGMMILQYTAASIVSQNKQYATPASVDSIVSSNGQEDHVSMGANAATKTNRIIKNVQSVLAIELLAAAQGIEERHPKKTSAFLEHLKSSLRVSVSTLDTDRVLHDDIVKAKQMMEHTKLDADVIFN
ncbi:histidine ammonia-lyase [Nonlabens ulvanivorans]|uniref:Histidine ammonia-lyase n=1 Tax=Nonlabens ulvanivorans TaxID=906888 RepID=A0A084JW54_NONUL|nr:histidine ammonia-lyase [Nonlabens ulvanivorans]KEZ93188.1 histidine ammonia-lyase [Nonlabens ulvanivorans]PRX13690.1 histidine ammonia-lyase [Nonlabens ulvanivorans]